MKISISLLSAMVLILAHGSARADAPATAHADVPAAIAAATPTTKPVTGNDQSDDLNFRDTSPSKTTRLGGGARGADTGPNVFLLVSAKPGRTISPRPVIYWYLTDDTEADVDLVISQPGQTEPTYRHRHTGKLAKGLHTFTLADAPADLLTGIQYKVTVMVWEIPDDPSQNPFSTGYLERVSPPGSLTDAGKDASAADLSRAGLWYDALDALSRRIEQEPTNAHLRNQRLSLVRQQEIFLTFAPGKQYDNISGVAEAAQVARKREKQLLDALANADAQEMPATKESGK